MSLILLLFFLFVWFLLFGSLHDVEEEPDCLSVWLWYYRNNRDFEGWSLWLWDNSQPEKSCELFPVRVEKDRILFEICPDSSWKIPCFLLKKGQWEDKEGADRTLPAAGRYYLVQGKKNIYTKKPLVKPALLQAFLDSHSKVQVHLGMPLPVEKIHFFLKTPDNRILEVEEVSVLQRGYEAVLHLKNPLRLSNKDLCLYQVCLDGYQSCFLQIRGILYDSEYYSEETMGLSFEKDHAVFRTFAPTARSVELLLFKTVDSHPQAFPMKEKRTGFFEICFPAQDVMDQFYMYRVHGDDFIKKVRDVTDPYAKLALHRKGMAKIFMDSVSISPSPVFELSETVIWEVHVRDFSIHENSGMEPKGKFLAFTQKNTHLKGDLSISTGLAHLKELGVNTIHLLPVNHFDQDDESGTYDWGYMPVLWFSLFGGYATCTLDDTRIREFKALISTLHEEGFKVVMDVVFNHTAEPVNDAWNLNGLAPGYYYRRNHFGQYFNGSGCGNEFKSEAPMARKLILDCLKYWMKDFGVDGFRFDLLGLMDYTTFCLIEKELKAIHPDVILYGEPWAGGDAGIEITGKGAQRNLGFSVFNDHFRDAIRGDNSKDGIGWVQAGYRLEQIWKGVCGGIHDFSHHPLESVNYVACHDNYTLYDKLALSTGELDFSREEVKRMEKLCAVLLFTSQGIPFLHAGQEFSRTKNGDHNSYQSPDSVNAIDWGLKQKRKDVFEFYKSMIQLRKQHRLFRLQTREEVENSLFPLSLLKGFTQDHGCFGFALFNHGLIDSFSQAVVCINPTNQKRELHIEDFSEFRVLLFKEIIELKVAKMPFLQSSLIELEPKTALILVKINAAKNALPERKIK